MHYFFHGKQWPTASGNSSRKPPTASSIWNTSHLYKVLVWAKPRCSEHWTVKKLFCLLLPFQSWNPIWWCATKAAEMESETSIRFVADSLRETVNEDWFWIMAEYFYITRQLYKGSLHLAWMRWLFNLDLCQTPNHGCDHGIICKPSFPAIPTLGRHPTRKTSAFWFCRHGLTAAVCFICLKEKVLDIQQK